VHGLRRKEAKKKLDEKLATNMANWLTKKINNENHEKKILVQHLNQHQKIH